MSLDPFGAAGIADPEQKQAILNVYNRYRNAGVGGSLQALINLCTPSINAAEIGKISIEMGRVSDETEPREA